MLYILQLAVNGIAQGFIISLAALSITMVFGVARFMNASTGDGMTVGAYALYAGQKATGSLVLGSIFAGILSSTVSVLAYFFIFRKLSGRNNVVLLLASVGLAFFLRACVGLLYGHQPQLLALTIHRPYMIGGLAINVLDLQLAAISLIVLAICFFVLHFSQIGREMRAVAENGDLARVSGVSPQRVMLVLWAMTGLTTAAAGGILGAKTVIAPEMGWEMLLPAFATAILGGLGSPVGAVVAGILLGMAQELATPFVGFSYKIAIYFLVLILVLLFRPRGLFGRVEEAR